MKSLYLVRHAKAKLAGPFDDDIDRPLNDRGENDARALGAHLRSEGVTLDQILCSPSLRTRQTHEIISKILDTLAEATILPELYLADDDEIVSAIRNVPESRSKVMVICHNPGLEDLVESIGSRRSGLELEDLPTCAMATIECPGWREFSPGAAHVSAVWRP